MFELAIIISFMSYKLIQIKTVSFYVKLNGVTAYIQHLCIVSSYSYIYETIILKITFSITFI